MVQRMKDGLYGKYIPLKDKEKYKTKYSCVDKESKLVFMVYYDPFWPNFGVTFTLPKNKFDDNLIHDIFFKKLRLGYSIQYNCDASFFTIGLDGFEMIGQDPDLYKHKRKLDKIDKTLVKIACANVARIIEGYK